MMIDKKWYKPSVNTSDEVSRATHAIILLVSGLLLAFILWASFTELDEVTRGDGKVIPSQKTQIIQSAERGIIKEIAVRLGQRISKGDLVFRLDKTPTEANLGEQEAKRRALIAQIARLEFEHQSEPGAKFTCPKGNHKLDKEICENETKLHEARVKNFEARVDVYEERVEQKKRELGEAAANLARIEEGLELAKKELNMIKPLADRKIIAATELIDSQKAVSELVGQLSTAMETQERVKAALREAELQVQEQLLDFKQKAQAELTEKKAELSVVLETIRGAAERVRRTDVYSPIDGIVNEILVTTKGAFVNAGDEVVSIVPVEDQLLVEARIKPRDIAFIRPGQKALVKVTAFDFAIFGGLEGAVENVSADTLVDPITKEPYYTVIIKTEESALTSNFARHKIMPGMICNVDILTGKKTIMSYLLKPINRAQEVAFRER